MPSDQREDEPRPIPDLREKARQRLAGSPTDLSDWSPADLKALVSELELHQEELRIQNEELQRAQSEASRAHEQYRDLFERAPVGYLLMDRQGRMEGANLRSEELLGTSRAGLKGAELAAFIAPKDQDTWFHFRRSLDPRMERRAEELSLAPGSDTEGRIVRLEAVPEPDIRPDAPRFRCALSDITVRAQAEHLNRNLLENLGQGVFGIDRTGRFTFVNLTGLKLLGYDHEQELLGGNSHQLIHHTDAEGAPYPESECPISRIMESGKPLEAWQDWLWQRDGTGFPAEIFATPLGRTSGPIEGVVVIFNDISNRKAREETLLKFQSAFEQSRDAAMFLDRDQFLSANSATLAMFRVPNAEVFRGYYTEDLSPTFQPDGRSSQEAWHAWIRTAFSQSQAFFEWQHQTVDGETFPAEVQLSRIDLAHGPILEAVIRDITEQKTAFEQILQARNRAQKYFDVAGVMMLVLDPEVRIAAINPKGCELLGLPREAILGADWITHFIPAEVQEDVRSYFHELLRGGMTETDYGENAILTGNGQKPLLAFHNTLLTDSEGNIEGILSSGVDITQQRELEEGLRYEAHHDTLTGLYNRRTILETLDREMGRAHRYRGNLALLMFDLDHFKAINDRFGHETGDQVLKEVARQTQEEFRMADLLGRWGGEEFIAILPDTTLDAAEALAERIRQAVTKVALDKVGEVNVSLSVAPLEVGETRKELLRRLDDTLYRAKAQGRNRVERT